MKKLITTLTVLALGLLPIVSAQAASPAEDREALRGFFKKHISDVKLEDMKNGVYSLDADARSQWEEIEEFPPYEIALDKGVELWEKKFANGKSFADCFGADISKIRVKYPYHDEAKDTIETIAAVSAHIAYAGRDQKITTEPTTEKAKAWYAKGKNFFYAKRGQLNMACADCHVYNSNRMIRGDLLSPALGHTTHFPVFRSKWGSLGTLHRRYGGCNKQVRAKDFKAQSDEYKALEYFQAVMSKDMVLNGPGARNTAVTAGGADDAIAAAKKSQKEAKALGFEWRDMGKNIKKAEALAKDGKDKKAIKIANKIAGQIEAIKKQAEVAKTAGPTF
ncbi:SoxAX cytochrome complex subunit A [Nymphon striatum]|nr:SoxAX cytochrome complex subunit A [Nymphon striatum]